MADSVKIRRQSNYELMRLMSILFIVIMHVIGTIMETQSKENIEILIFINSITNTGVSLFILLSGYFGIKFKWQRLFDVVFMVLFYSWLSFISDTFIFHKALVAKEYIPYVFPLLSKKWWFISCYVVLYCISKWINEACLKMTHLSFRNLLLVLCVFFYIAPTLLIFYELTDASGKGIVNMVILYMIGRYVKLYGFPVIIREHSKFVLTLCIMLVFVLNSVLSIVGNTAILRFSTDNSILILVESLAIFYMFSEINFQSKFINIFASIVFGIYLGHTMVINILEQYIRLDCNDTKVWLLLTEMFLIVILCCLAMELIRLIVTYPIRRIRGKIYSSFPTKMRGIL